MFVHMKSLLLRRQRHDIGLLSANQRVIECDCCKVGITRLDGHDKPTVTNKYNKPTITNTYDKKIFNFQNRSRCQDCKTFCKKYLQILILGELGSHDSKTTWSCSKSLVRHTPLPPFPICQSPDKIRHSKFLD